VKDAQVPDQASLVDGAQLVDHDLAVFAGEPDVHA